jgi:spore coat protein CotH
MRRFLLFAGVATVAVAAVVSIARAEDGKIRLRVQNANAFIQIQGDDDDDWWLEVSTNLTAWTTLTNFGTLLSGDMTNAPWRLGVGLANSQQFLRARKTDGLYDTALMRTISLTFTQANLSNLLALARTYETNVYCSQLTVDNGATNIGVGARFRGNTSFTGIGGPGGGSGPPKKSLNIEVDFAITNADLMGIDTFNLNNAYGDETIMREAVYFNLMRQYTVCPRAAMARLFVNGTNWGVYSFVQQQDDDLMEDWFRSSSGDRWRAPNMDEKGSLVYLGNTNLATYTPYYTLKSAYNTNAWPRLINTIYVLNNTATNVLRDKVEDVLAVDGWLWFLAIENILADDDSYWNKGSDYMLYYEPESGRMHAVEHDGNEAFVAGDVALSPVQGSTSTMRPVLYRLLSIAELRQRYLAHMRTVLAESFHPAKLTPVINHFHAQSIAAIIADPLRGYVSMSTYTNDLIVLKTFVTNRYNYLVNHAELTPLAPIISSVSGPTNSVTATNIPWVTATVAANGANGINSVWLYHRGKPYGKFAYTQMFDDGAHGDGLSGDGVFGAATTNYPAGSKVRFYVEARSANTARAASYSPPRAEQETWSYRVSVTTASNTPVVINEFMASNTSALPDPQGEYDDWIELHNVTSQAVDLTGRYLSDEPYHPRKWQFPAGTTIPANGYLLVWADEDTTDTPGLHASFKLSADGEEFYLADTDANFNAVLDYVAYSTQQTDVSYGRTAADADEWDFMTPTPEQPNQ